MMAYISDPMFDARINRIEALGDYVEAWNIGNSKTIITAWKTLCVWHRIELKYLKEAEKKRVGGPAQANGNF
jgi:hypothetical protein